MNGQMSAFLAITLSTLSAVLVAIVSKWWDKHVERKYGGKKSLTEAELAVAVEKAKASNTAEGYLWKRIETLENHLDISRKENSELQVKLSKAIDDYEEAARQAGAFATKMEEASRKLEGCQEENMKLVRKIVSLEGMS